MARTPSRLVPAAGAAVCRRALTGLWVRRTTNGASNAEPVSVRPGSQAGASRWSSANGMNIKTAR
ncbi:hypothetical protein [Actinoallomurus soli]|uniref:hypothetical protein n=1 Tax=Actinoallomurus soli TaxID=2952535 RepID=UPI0020929287|nr:hypothetical protein [Actinoallomurus soli]MCO5972415.1 hypothetical protein [Actinoallomurus soli]